MYKKLHVPEPGNLAVTRGMFAASRYSSEVTPMVKAGFAVEGEPVVETMSRHRLDSRFPRCAVLAQNMVRKLEKRSGLLVADYNAAFIICAAGVVFPAHTDQKKTIRLNLEMAESVHVLEYPKGPYVPGRMINEPGNPVLIEPLDEGGVLVVNNICEAEDRSVHATVTNDSVNGNRVALAITTDIIG